MIVFPKFKCSKRSTSSLVRVTESRSVPLSGSRHHRKHQFSMFFQEPQWRKIFGHLANLEEVLRCHLQTSKTPSSCPAPATHMYQSLSVGNKALQHIFESSLCRALCSSFPRKLVVDERAQLSPELSMQGKTKPQSCRGLIHITVGTSSATVPHADLSPIDNTPVPAHGLSEVKAFLRPPASFFSTTRLKKQSEPARSQRQENSNEMNYEIELRTVRISFP